ncbi:unnamed protein product [Mytilus coruscus]|uniref:Ig-like domain-containing protein n=1 Tax=Mytilus coruscus TaxID=42192 RepID=A0A6J8B234_MYTCO|nr:unnamed protein product [Mytilus coruscus]
MLFRFLLLVQVCAAFPLKCPEPAQWSFRARSHCPDPSKYFCLKNDLINGYSENCTVSDFLKSGRKHVIRGGLDADICSTERYQPSSINFYTNVSTNCIFLKSACNEEGQVVNDNRNRNTDTTCRCDYTNGYNFLVKPRNPCFCIPSEEDCSCYLKTCLDSTFKLSPAHFISLPADNKTIIEGQSVFLEYKLLINRFAITYKRRNLSLREANHISITDAGHLKILMIKHIALTDEGNYCMEAEGIKSKSTKLIVKPLFKRPLKVSRSVEGSHTVFECETEKEDNDVEWFKDNVKMTDNTEKLETEEGYIYKFTIKKTHVKDSGTYRIQKNGIHSEVILEVKALFKRPLKVSRSVEGSHTIFECETEKEDNDVEWFKDNVKMTDNTEKLETEEGYIYKFTIKKTHVKDSGTYRIQKNGIHSEVILEVKALFKRPLKVSRSVEGSHTVFECETDKEDNDVEWFKDNVKMTDNTEKLETEEGYIYKFTIKKTHVKDSGTYRIQKNGIHSEVILEVKALFKRPLIFSRSVEGSHTIFECETEKEDNNVEWFKDNVKMTDNTEKLETEEGYIYKFTIKKTHVKDSGTYRIQKNGIHSEVILEVKVLFKRPLKDVNSVEGSHTIFECETEKENGAVEWFKDDVKMTVHPEKLETEQGYIYKMTINHTRVEDSGTYRIEKNGICSEAGLGVKEKESGVVEWYKGEVTIADNTEQMEAPDGYIYKMTIKHTGVEHSGQYRIIKNCICSEASLEVQALFKRPLKNITIIEGLDMQFDCETEEHNSSVEWYKDDVLIMMNTANIKKETFPGNIHTLTISPARLQDSGRFRIEKNGISSEAVLDVKGNKVNCLSLQNKEKEKREK